MSRDQQQAAELDAARGHARGLDEDVSRLVTALATERVARADLVAKVAEVVRDMDDGEGFAARCCHDAAARMRAVLDTQ